MGFRVRAGEFRVSMEGRNILHSDSIGIIFPYSRLQTRKPRRCRAEDLGIRHRFGVLALQDLGSLAFGLGDLVLRGLGSVLNLGFRSGDIRIISR